VSLHCMWLAKRRFNQAELIAKGVVGRIEAPVLDKLKVVRRTRIRSSSPPTSAGRTSRAPTRHEGPWRARFLLVDDVFTTGATLSECAESLRKAGAGEVHALTLYRTV
jgi:predicted amidophosphoribosyltransferase